MGTKKKTETGRTWNRDLTLRSRNLNKENKIAFVTEWLAKEKKTANNWLSKVLVSVELSTH